MTGTREDEPRNEPEKDAHAEPSEKARDLLPQADSQPPHDEPLPGDARRLFVLGFLTLFLELTLIRYLAGSIWNLGYFPNLVLLSVFIGMGLGFVLHNRASTRLSPWLFRAAPAVLLALVATATFAHPNVPGFTSYGGKIGGEVYFTSTPRGPATWSYVPIFVCAVAIVGVFALCAQRTAKLFRVFSPLRAYTLDIAGSCSGIVSFMVLSYFQVPAWGWFLVVTPLFLFSAPPGSWLRTSVPLLFVIACAACAWNGDQRLMWKHAYQGAFEVAWSPYQKIEYVNAEKQIYVNGIAHQSMYRAEQLVYHFYQVPHTSRKQDGKAPYKNVLIIGAGSGNDVAAALASGAEHVDALEIDPVISRIGKKYHPEKPYDDPRVTLHNDDGRAFLTRSTRKYDLIVFALTDSLVKVSSMAQLRLENYLFTADSIRRAYSLLSEDGDVVLYNYYREAWLIEKYQRMMFEATGKYPTLLHKFQDFEMLAVGRERPSAPAPAFRFAAMDIPTDDWPFPYLDKRSIPELYLNALIGVGTVIVLIAAWLYLDSKRREDVRDAADAYTTLAFLFMGIAFLLLETKSIVQFSLLFGTTWVNTSLVFLGVLTLVLFANWVAVPLKKEKALPAIFVLLLGSCLLTLFYPLSNLLRLESAALRFVIATLMTFSPIFFANLVFSLTFRDQSVPEHLFGWNLLGATFGGLVEYTSMATGYNALAVLVAICYALVFVCLRFANRAAVSASSREVTAG